MIRAVFILFAAASIAGASYVGFYGIGGESADLDRSVRAGSGGNGVIGRVK